MISEIQIENFKSIEKLSMELGSVTVLIGENGGGKSNILEAIAFAAAATSNKLDDEFLFTRGIRVTDKRWMVSAFNTINSDAPPWERDSHVKFRAIGEKKDTRLDFIIRSWDFGGPHPESWHVTHEVSREELAQAETYEEFANEVEQAREILKEGRTDTIKRLAAMFLAEKMKHKATPAISAQLALRDFLIYSPENSFLRRFEDEGAIKPLGIHGEGLLKLLQETATFDENFSAKLECYLKFLGWFGFLKLPSEGDKIKGRVLIKDRWLPEDSPLFDQRSANEGFLFLLFYFTLILSDATPKFFAIDNIDNSLNPKLCAELMRQIASAASEKKKQIICTTHNPAILDGMNLKDDSQRLYVVRRNSEGRTVLSRVKPPRERPGGEPIRLSSAFMSGMLGGVPDHF